VAREPHERVTTPADEMAVTTPISGEAAAARVRIKAVEDSVADIKTDIKEIRNHQHTDFVHTMEIFGTGFLLLAGMLIAAYFIIDGKFEKVDGKFDKLNERINALSTSNSRIDTKLEDLLARIPPVPTPPRSVAPQK
jgi:hypothetical protein